MEYLSDFIKILLPAGVVLYAMVITVKSFLNNDFEKKLADYTGAKYASALRGLAKGHTRKLAKNQ